MISPERLRHFAHFSGMPGNLLQKVAMITSERSYSAGESLFVEGNPATHLMLLESGEVNITYRLGDDREVVVDTLVAGETMCWSALFPPHTLTGSGVGNKEGKVLMIEAEPLRALLREYPEHGLNLLIEVGKVLRGRLGATRVQLAAVR
jgi:CRP/FNR family transcriptional regulator